MNTEKPLQDAVKHHIDEKDALNRKAQAANCAATVLADECGKLRKRVAELEDFLVASRKQSANNADALVAEQAEHLVTAHKLRAAEAATRLHNMKAAHLATQRALVDAVPWQGMDHAQEVLLKHATVIAAARAAVEKADEKDTTTNSAERGAEGDE